MPNAAVPGATHAKRLEDWISRYSDIILRTCFVYLSDRDLAQDAMQETFFKAWRYMPQYERKQITNDKAWLLRIAVNVCHDLHRSAWHRHIDARRELSELPPQAVAAQPEERDLMLDICALPEKYKQVILLYYYHELTLQETADALSTAPSTVHKRLKKAQLLLSGRLTGREPHHG